MKCVTILLIAGLFCPLFAQNQFPKNQATPDFAHLGPVAGGMMPDFRAPDEHGNPHQLKDLLGPNGALILFFGSADWSPYCKGQLVELQRNLSEIRKLGLGVAALSYDSPAVLRNFAERKGIEYPLLSDPESQVIRETGLLNRSIPKDSSSYGIPYPGVFVVDAHGRITGKYFEQDFTRRYTAGDILVRQFGLTPNVDAQEIKGRQVTVTTSASTAAVSAGQRIALVLEMNLKPNMHVYAPGVTGYIPIQWKMGGSAAWISEPPDYPKGQMLNLPVIDETVPVYEGRVRIVRDLQIGSDREVEAAKDSQGRLAISGTFRYQACDDRICYIPQTLPLEWTFQVTPHDRTRAPSELRRKAHASR
ncbi:MAG: redoxin domain-containing protein [Bryobacteraceae bacterium]